MKRLLLVLLMCAPAWAANDFTKDVNCVVLYTFEDGIGDNTWSDTSGNGNDLTGTVDGNNATYYTEGSASSEWANNLTVSIRSDASLSSTFPLKSTYAGTTRISMCCWFRYEGSGDSIAGIWGKYYHSTDERCLTTVVYDDAGTDRLRTIIGQNGGADWINLDFTTVSIQLNRWYHVGLTYDDSTKDIRMRLYDSVTFDVNDVNDVGVGAIPLNNENLTLGSRQTPLGQNYQWDGQIDEFVVFNDILTADEIDLIRQGLYGAPAATGTSNWWWRRRHN